MTAPRKRPAENGGFQYGGSCLWLRHRNVETRSDDEARYFCFSINILGDSTGKRHPKVMSMVISGYMTIVVTYGLPWKEL